MFINHGKSDQIALAPIDSMLSFIDRTKLACVVVILGVEMLPVASLFSQNLPPKAIEAFMSDNCFECHDDSTTKGNLNLLDLARTHSNRHM